MLITLTNREQVPPGYTGTVQRPYSKEWYKEDKLHRADGRPAVEWADGSKLWYFEGLIHRADGPAYVRADGSKEWWFEGKWHRVDGPAYEDAKGYKTWSLLDSQITKETSIILVI